MLRETPETALLFSNALGTTAEFWLNLEAAYRLDILSLGRQNGDQVVRKSITAKSKLSSRTILPSNYIYSRLSVPVIPVPKSLTTSVYKVTNKWNNRKNIEEVLQWLQMPKRY